MSGPGGAPEAGRAGGPAERGGAAVGGAGASAGRPAGAAEFELKGRLGGELPGPDALRAALEESGWRRTFTGEMIDRRLDTEGGDLEARDEVVRVRRFRPDAGPERAVLGWKGPASEAGGFKRREEIETDVADGAAARALLARLGLDRVTLALDRRIEVWEKDGVTVRIEEYPAMDVLAEIEGEPAEVEARIEELGLPREAWKPWPLPRFVERFEERTGAAARLAREEGGGG